MIFNTGLTHLGSEASKSKRFYFPMIEFNLNLLDKHLVQLNCSLFAKSLTNQIKFQFHAFIVINSITFLYFLWFFSYFYMIVNLKFFTLIYFTTSTSLRGASDSVTDSSVLSNPADAHNVSCLGLCGRDICPKSSA